jgi:hypothetical protein
MPIHTIASIDVGYRNFAIAIESFNTPIASKNPEDIYSGNLIFFHNQDFGVRKKTTIDDNPLLGAILKWLNTHKDSFDKCQTVIIEQQLKTNPFAQKIEHMVHAWFLIHYGDKFDVRPFSATHKTRVLNAPKKMTKPERKKWAVEKATEILCGRGDVVGLEILEDNKRKADDISDCCLMIQSWKILNIEKLCRKD